MNIINVKDLIKKDKIKTVKIQPKCAWLHIVSIQKQKLSAPIKLRLNT